MAQETPTLEAAPRERVGSRYARRLRRAGQLPAVIYGHGEPPAHVALDAEALRHHLHEGTRLFELRHDGRTETCLLKDVQYDHLGSEVVHIDLARIDMAEEVTVMVPVVVKGQNEAPGAKEAGAYVAQPLVDLEVTCRADAIPEELVVDISRLNVWESVLVRDLPLPGGVRTEHDPEDTVISIHVAQEEEAEAAEEPASAEPEVLAERKEEEQKE